jgi:hypothetical protein
MANTRTLPAASCFRQSFPNFSESEDDVQASLISAVSLRSSILRLLLSMNLMSSLNFSKTFLLFVNKANDLNVSNNVGLFRHAKASIA